MTWSGDAVDLKTALTSLVATGIRAVHGTDGADSVDHALLLEEGRASSTRLLLHSLLPHQ
jgi:hypothetical protein